MSLREVASATGLPLGTVKTITSRSGAFRDNETHRLLFTLPPVRKTEENLPAAPELPPQQVITGDNEIDALLWLRAVISTGQPQAITVAIEAAKKIKTPRKELEQRYRAYLRVNRPGDMFAEITSFDLGDLAGLASKSVEKSLLRIEADARFGSSLFSNTDAELFCISALDGLGFGRLISPGSAEIAARFIARPELMPNTLSDCLHELDYWNRLYWFRDCEGAPEATSRDRFVFGLLAEIRPRCRDEAKAVLRYLNGSDSRDTEEADAILDNLIG